MQKPVHLVPMNTRNAVTGNYEWRDVVMPGIGLYRIQADRSRTMAGISEPEFGDDITQEFTDKSGNKISFTFPEWCKISVKKLIDGNIVEFVAKEYWLENYATDSGKSTAPNTMWKKRPKGQIAKCAEAQALRKGWPEIGQSPTAEEMEGKLIDMGEVEITSEAATAEPEQTLLPAYPQELFDKNKSSYVDLIVAGRPIENIFNKIESKYTMTEAQKNTLREFVPAN